MLEEANQFHPNIKFVLQLDTTVSFLDVNIVPFRSDHPRHVFNNVINGALMRATRYSSTLSVFNEEQRALKLMLFYNK
jgi:hypothetical protein